MGFRQHRLDVHDVHATVVRDIFKLYINGTGPQAIAHTLNAAGVPCPSAADPEREPAPIRTCVGDRNSPRESSTTAPTRAFASTGGSRRQNGSSMTASPTSATQPFDASAPTSPSSLSAPASSTVRPGSVQTAAKGATEQASHHRPLQPRRARQVSARRARPMRTLWRSMQGHSKSRKSSSPRLLYGCKPRTSSSRLSATTNHPPSVYVPEDRLIEAVDAWIADTFSARRSARTLSISISTQPASPTPRSTACS